jgi:nitrite reductase (cytochrome c-552)
MTAGDKFYGGSNAMPESKLESNPWLKRLYAGYAFSIDYREARGHAYMLYDQVVTERVNKRPQAGACLHCHGSATGALSQSRVRSPRQARRRRHPRRLLRHARRHQGLPDAQHTSLTTRCSRCSRRSPTARRGRQTDLRRPRPSAASRRTRFPEGHFAMGEAHPVSCIDCHDPTSMKVRVTRPGFVIGMQALAQSEEPCRTCPASRNGAEATAPSPTTRTNSRPARRCARSPAASATSSTTAPQRTRSRSRGATASRSNRSRAFWENKHSSPTARSSWTTSTAKPVPPLQGTAPRVRALEPGRPRPRGRQLRRLPHALRTRRRNEAQQPQRRSPMENIEQRLPHVPQRPCRRTPRIVSRPSRARTVQLMDRAAHAMTDMLDAIMEAKASGVSDELLSETFALQRKAMWRLDYISSENSKGLPRRPGSRPDPRRVDRLQPPGTGDGAAPARAHRPRAIFRSRPPRVFLRSDEPTVVLRN